jgi:hypothetical protein
MMADAAFMDSDAGGRTADERAVALRQLAMHDDESDNDADLVVDEIPPYVAPAFVEPVPTHKPPAPKRAVDPPLPVIPPKPAYRGQPPRGRAMAPKSQSMPVHRASAGVAAALPDNRDDDDDEDDEDVGDWPVQPHVAQESPRVVQSAPAPVAKPTAGHAQPPAGGEEDSGAFTFPSEPREALIRFDAVMTYMMEIICQLTGDNIHALTARETLKVFRAQMLSWGKLRDNKDWEKAADYMLMYGETFRMLVKTTASQLKQARQNHVPQAPAQPQIQPAPVKPPATARSALDGIPRAIQTDVDLAADALAIRHMSPVPPGQHLNPVNAAGSSSAGKTPAYIASAEEGPPQPSHKESSDCTVS